MEFKDNRKLDMEGNAKAEPSVVYDDFRPTLAGFQPLNDMLLLRELVLPDESMIATPDAYAEPCLYCEVIAGAGFVGDIVRILANVGTTVKFSDGAEGQRYLTVNYQDIMGRWAR